MRKTTTAATRQMAPAVTQAGVYVVRDERITPEWRPAGPEKIKLRVPVERAAATEILGSGPEAAPKVVELLQRLGLVS